MSCLLITRGAGFTSAGSDSISGVSISVDSIGGSIAFGSIGDSIFGGSLIGCSIIGDSTFGSSISGNSSSNSASGSIAVVISGLSISKIGSSFSNRSTPDCGSLLKILLGGGRNLDFEGETTTKIEITNFIQDHLENLLKTVVLSDYKYTIEHRWAGIMGMGDSKNPIVEQLSENVFCGVRLGGMGVAIGSLVGAELADLFKKT